MPLAWRWGQERAALLLAGDLRVGEGLAGWVHVISWSRGVGACPAQDRLPATLPALSGAPCQLRHLPGPSGKSVTPAANPNDAVGLPEPRDELGTVPLPGEMGWLLPGG